MNWGWRIALFLTLFIGFIMYMVIYSFTTTNDLVADDYYNQEIQYQENIDAQKNALPFSKEVKIKPTSEGIILTFPADFNIPYTKGDISFYRPDNAKLDVNFPLKLNENNRQIIKNEKIIPGIYKVTIQFTQGDKVYLMNKDIWV